MTATAGDQSSSSGGFLCSRLEGAFFPSPFRGSNRLHFEENETKDSLRIVELILPIIFPERKWNDSSADDRIVNGKRGCRLVWGSPFQIPTAQKGFTRRPQLSLSSSSLTKVS